MSTSPVEEWSGTLAAGEIRESPFNHRRTYDPVKLQELADSMLAHGQLAPLVVRPLGDNPRLKKGKWEGVEAWELVCGHRRLRAAKLAGIPHLKVVTRQLDDAAARCIQLIENVQREDVTPSEQAAAVGELVEAVSQEEAAKQVGWPLARVRDLLRLASLPEWFLSAVDAGEVPLSTAAIVGRIPGDTNRTTAALCVITGTWDPRDLEDGDLAECEQGRAAEIRLNTDGQVLSVKDTKELVRRFQRELKGQPWRKALDLVDGVPICNECPKMAGNAAKTDDTYADVRADTCLDPECFAEKQAAWGKLTVARAEKKGRTVLPAVAAAKLFNEYNPDTLRYDSGYVELDDVCYDDRRNGHEPRTYGELLKGHVEPVLAIDPKGRARDLVDRKAAAEVLKREHKIGIRNDTPARGSADDKAEKAKRAAENKLRRAVVSEVLDRASAAAAELYAEREPGLTILLSAIARETVRTCWGTSLEDVCDLRGHKGTAGERRAALDKWIAGAQPAELFGLVVEFLAARQLFGYGMDREAKVLGGALGVDKKAIEKQVKEQFKAEGKGGGKKAKAPPAKKPAVPTCRVCQCTEDDCRQCIAKTGRPCSWAEPDLCTACVGVDVRTSPSAEVLLADVARFPEVVREALDRKGVRTVAKLLEIAAPDPGSPRTDLFTFLQKLPGVGKGPSATAADAIVDRDVLPPADPAPTSQPGPIVCRPLGELMLAGIDGLTHDDVQCLSAVGVRTLGDLEKKCEQLPTIDRAQEVSHQIGQVLDKFKGAFTYHDVDRIVAAVVAHLKLARPQAKAGSPLLSTIPRLLPHVVTLSAAGLKTVADLAEACEQVRLKKRMPAAVGDPVIDSGIYSFLREKLGANDDTYQAINAVGDAVMDYVGHEKARKQLADQPTPPPVKKPAKAKAK